MRDVEGIDREDDDRAVQNVEVDLGVQDAALPTARELDDTIDGAASHRGIMCVRTG
jgi:hypothetical protein